MGEAAEMKHRRKTVDQEMADLFHHFQEEKEHSHIQTLADPWFYKIWDTSQKFLFLRDSALVAAPLQSSNSEVELMALAPNEALDASKHPIFLGTKDRKKVLTVRSGGQPQLQLVAGDVMDLHKKKEQSIEFTFYNQTKGSETTCSFESAASPSWFLSTSPEQNKPLGLSQEGGSNITLFYIEKKG